MPTKPVWSIENPNEVSSSQTRDGDSAEKRRQIPDCTFSVSLPKYGKIMRFAETRGMIVRS